MARKKTHFKIAFKENRQKKKGKRYTGLKKSQSYKTLTLKKQTPVEDYEIKTTKKGYFLRHIKRLIKHIHIHTQKNK